MAIHNYKLSKLTLKKKTRTAPPIPPHRQCVWFPCHTTYNTHPINPYLDTVLTGAFEITSHPISLDLALLHAPDGRLISTITKARLHKLSNIYHPQANASTFPEDVSQAILRHKAATYKETYTNERDLHKQQKKSATITRGTMAHTQHLIRHIVQILPNQKSHTLQPHDPPPKGQ